MTTKYVSLSAGVTSDLTTAPISLTTGTAYTIQNLGPTTLRIHVSTSNTFSPTKALPGSRIPVGANRLVKPAASQHVYVWTDTDTATIAIDDAVLS